MKELRLAGWGIIALTFLLAITLMLLPLPAWAEPFRPAWLLLVVIYWTLALPHRIGIVIAGLLGLLLDGLQGTLLGENAIVFAIIVYITIKMHRRIRMFHLLGQALTIFLLVLINQLLLFWIEGLQNHTVSMQWFWGNPLASAILWPWIYMVLTDCVKRYRLN